MSWATCSPSEQQTATHRPVAALGSETGARKQKQGQLPHVRGGKADAGGLTSLCQQPQQHPHSPTMDSTTVTPAVRERILEDLEGPAEHIFSTIFFGLQCHVIPQRPRGLISRCHCTAAMLKATSPLANQSSPNQSFRFSHAKSF